MALPATKYGHFSEDGSEYVITEPRTPRPWINVISNGDYGVAVSQAGSGYSWRTHAQLNRITRWEQDLIRDNWGKYLYLRDEQGRVWSAGWKPVCSEPDDYRCTHGTGYSIIASEQHGVATSLTVFVPEEEPLEVWILTLRNTSRRERRIDLITYFEWCLGAAPDWHREFHRSFIETRYEPRSRAIFATKRLWEVPTDRGHWNTDWPYVAFHSSSMRPASFETDKEAFLGMYGSLRAPAAVRQGRLGRHQGNGLDPVGALHCRIRLAPRAEETVVFTLGAADSVEQARTLCARYRTAKSAYQALGRVKESWRRRLSTVTVATPDPAMDVMENIWLKYQSISGRLWGRTAYYQTGGAYGFRDQLQDSQIFLPIDPAETKKQILLHARHQFADGSVYHWWHPITEIGLRNQISDNLLWLPYVVKSYLDETADLAFLEERAPFVDDPSGASIYEHCVRAIDRALDRFSLRGLPLIGGGDWNDGLSAVGLEMKGESIWLGHFLHRILRDFTSVAELHGDARHAQRYPERAAQLKEALNRDGWDGAWYFGATKDSGERLGSRENTQGRVWLNPQTWAVIGGVADEQRARQVLAVVEQELDSEIGPLLLAPAYSTPDREIGYLTRYAPGMRENGGVYTHGATWAVIAAAMLGNGESAYRMYAKLNPVNRGRRPDRYRAEPYVTSGNIEGPDAPSFGRGGWTWYSGSAAWLFKAGLEWVLGIRPSLNGLIVDPCIPPSWRRFTVTRTFRGAVYHIEVRNPGHVMCGVQSVTIDGEPYAAIAGPRTAMLPLFDSGTRHSVVVELGRVP